MPRGVDGQEGQWGMSVKGRIVYGGATIPEQKPIASVAQSTDKGHCLEKGPILDEEWVINKKNRGLQWTFVWLAGPDPKAVVPIHASLKQLAKKEVVMDQPRCRFEPHALGMREGQILLAKNSSPIPHNYKWSGDPFAGATGGNVLLPPGGSIPIKDLKASRLPVLINCNIHGWMKAYVRVFTHPYFAVTDENGAFEIPSPPAGDYRLVVWNENGWLGGAKGKNGQPIAIKANAVTDVGNLEYKPNN
jgi:hypothetical protein